MYADQKNEARRQTNRRRNRRRERRRERKLRSGRPAFPGSGPAVKLPLDHKHFFNPTALPPGIYDLDGEPHA